MFESDRDSSNNAEEDKISLKERTHRNFDDMYLSDILLLIDVSKCQDQTLDYFLCFIGSRSHEETTNKRIRYILDNYCTVLESFCRYFHCLICECSHLFTNRLVTVPPRVNIFALRWIFGRGSSTPCFRRLQTSSWNSTRPRTWRMLLNKC